MTLNVGVVGLGLMGHSIAKNLVQAGFATVGYDTRSEAAVGIAGLTIVSSVAELGSSSDIVFLSLPGPPEVEAVCVGADGLAGRLKSGSIIVDLSTNSTAMVKKMQAALAVADIEFLDAPVSGGLWGAADGTLAIWVGGHRPAFDRA